MEGLLEIKKKRLIKRILDNSVIYNAAELDKKSLEELRKIQKITFIEIRIKKKFYSRNNNNF